MHYILPSSGAPRWVPCPGSLLLEAQYPDMETPEAAEGTASHWVVEQSLSTFKDPNGESLMPFNFIGKTAPNGIVIDEAMADGAAVMVTDVLRVANEYGALQNMLIEQRVRAPQIHELQGGTLDVSIDLVRSHGKLYIWDYKFGHVVVEAWDNWQAVCYFAGLYNLLELNGLADQNLEVHLRIVQPRAYHRLGSVREWKTTGGELRGYVNKAASSAEKSLQPNAPTIPGDHCSYCKARHTCTALGRSAQKAIAVTLQSQTDEMRPEDVVVELALLRYAKRLMSARLTGIEQYATSLIETGKLSADSGFKLERSKGRERFKADKKNEVIAIGKMFGKDVAKVELRTPNQVVGLGIDRELLADYIETPLGEAKLVEVDGHLAKLAFNKR